MTVGYHNIMAARGDFDSDETAPVKQDKKLNRALGKLFAAAAEGPIPIDKDLAKALTKIRDNKTLAGDAKAALYDTIINHVAIDERYNVSLAVYQDNDDPTVQRAMAARVYSDIHLLDDAQKFDAAFRVVQHVAIPSEEVAERIIDHVDALPQDEQFAALEDIFPHMDPHTDLVVEKMLDKIPNEPANERYDLARIVYHKTKNEDLKARAVKDALSYVDDSPAKDRVSNATDVFFTSADLALMGQAADVAIEHATVANKKTIAALSDILSHVEQYEPEIRHVILSDEQVMAIETALYTLTEKPPEKPAPLEPAEFVMKMWATPAP